MNGLAVDTVRLPGAMSETRVTTRPANFWLIVFLLLVHIPIALLMRQSVALATLHALATFGVGLFFLAVDQKPYRLIYFSGYITGAELLWRMTQASIFWESGKYAIIVLLGLALLKANRLAKADPRPLFYLALLVPSVALLPSFDRESIAFNMSGPVSLAVATMFFSTIRLSQRHLDNLFLAILAPIVGTAFLATYGTVTAEAIWFGHASNFATSAGIGPNQMSSVLGLGALVAFLYGIRASHSWLLRISLLGCSLWMLAQAVLTFSRGGVYTTLGAVAVAVFFLIGDNRTRTRLAIAAVALIALSYVVLLPAIDAFTHGAMSERFADFDTAKRDVLVLSDIQTFLENPLGGVGPGQSMASHEEDMGTASRAHTEFSRMLSEHGILGAIALIILLLIIGQRVFARAPLIQKAYILSFTAWAILFMSHSAMRLVAPSLLFGLGSISIEESQEADPAA